MPWSKHIWENDEVITSKKLNHMEYGLEKASGKGSGGETLIVHETYGYDSDLGAYVCTLDTTFIDIFDAANNGSNIYIVAHSNNNERIIFKVLFVSYDTYTDDGGLYINCSLTAAYVEDHFNDSVWYDLVFDDSHSRPKNWPNSYPYRYDTRYYGED